MRAYWEGRAGDGDPTIWALDDDGRHIAVIHRSDIHPDVRDIAWPILVDGMTK